MDEKWQVLKQKCRKSRKRKTETMKRELNAQFLKKNGFENRAESRLSDYKNFWRVQCRIRVDSVLNHFSSKSKNFSIVTFGGMNQACNYGDTWNWMERFFNIGSFLGILGLSGLRHMVRNQWWSNPAVHQKTKDWDLSAESQVSGYAQLVDGIGKKLWKSLAVVWLFWTNNIRIQRRKCLHLAVKLPLQLKICRFEFSWKKLNW